MPILRNSAVLIVHVLLASFSLAQQDTAKRLRELDTRVLPAEEAKRRQLDQMLAKHIRDRVHAAHRRVAEEWRAVRTRADWEKFRDTRSAALRRSLGDFPSPGKGKMHQVGVIEDDGYRIEKVIVAGRPGLPITANLYLPAKPPKAMPAIVVCHSFFHPKSQGELQDIGVNGARCGCAVLVFDLLGHGERRQHPFSDASSYPGKFNVPRQDYYMRSLLGLQLDLAGASLMGWMAADVIYCVDALLQRPDIDRDKIIVMGAVAAGGDVAAVAAALDPRISCVVPYNFGGPEPETPYPLPEAGELSFPYAAGGHWDSTRRLRHSARDGFLPWVVVGAVAPRRVIYAHEFAWDEEHDPAWKRLKRIYELYDQPTHLAAAFGKGTLFGKPEGTGCGNIGAFHRGTLAPHLRQWFNIDWPTKEIEKRRTETELRCLTPELREQWKPRPVFELAAELAKARRPGRDLRAEWAELLGPIDIKGDPKSASMGKERLGSVVVERLLIEPEPGIVVSTLLLTPQREGRWPVVVALCQQGKSAFLTNRAAEVAALLTQGVAVCLPDVRGTGETRSGGDQRGRPASLLVEMQRKSGGVLLANESLMLGETLVGARLRDVRAVLAHLRTRQDIDGKSVALWGDSFGKVNAPEARLEAPFDAADYPIQAEPLGGLLAVLTALFEPDVRAVYSRRGLSNYAGLLQSRFMHIPADVIVPGALLGGDLPWVVKALAPRAVRLTASVDQLNRGADSSDDPVRWLHEALR